MNDQLTRLFQTENTTNEWYTPSNIIELARGVMGGIELDPASSKAANKVVKAKKFYTKEDDGLAQTWRAKSLWMNPPFSRTDSGILMLPFAQKLVESYRSGDVLEACVLTHSRTENRWFRAYAEQAQRICFISKRLKFWNEVNAGTGSSPNGQVVFYFGQEGKKFTDAFKTVGLVMKVM